MIWNVVDGRSNKYNVNVKVVFEPSWHDNSIKDSSKAKGTDLFTISDLDKTTVGEAIEYGNKQWPDIQVTIFLYDIDSD